VSTESTCLRTVLAALVMTTAATSFANNTPTAGSAMPAEVAKATPIVAPVDATTAFILGTSERMPAASGPVSKSADVGAFRFPAVAGHLRGYATAKISSTATYSEQPALFDAAQMIPQVSYTGCARFDSSCRSVFTNVTAGDRPARVMLEEKSLGAVGPLLATGAALSEADQRMLMHRVLAGREVAPNTFAPALGGVERSTVAVIPPSKLTTFARPTMIYVGASDGMLHAVCGSVQSGVCDRIGRELWAYVPRSLLGSLRTGSAVVDGSPHVVEVMGDFNRDGVRELRTILVFTTGSTSSVHALDVTNPADPTIAWEYAPTSRGVTGVAISSGRFHTTQGPKVFAYVPTSAGPLLEREAVRHRPRAVHQQRRPDLCPRGLDRRDRYAVRHRALARDPPEPGAARRGIGR
jgi:hypothetical protein